MTPSIEPGSRDQSVLARLFPAPGPGARAFFRCLLFASIPVVSAATLGRLLEAFNFSADRLITASSILSEILMVPTFFLSFAFTRSEPRLALVGWGVLCLLLFVGDRPTIVS